MEAEVFEFPGTISYRTGGMVGHFLHPNRKSRSSSSTSSSSTSSIPHVASPTTTLTAAAASASGAYSNNNNNNNNNSNSNHNPPSAMTSPSRYAGASTGFDVPTMPFVPPQNLTAEAVAALPPPGTSKIAYADAVCVWVKREHEKCHR